MVFSSNIFLFIFLPLTLLVYYAVPKKFKNLILFLSGLVFYAWGEPVYVLIMILSTAIDYFAGRIMDSFNTNKNIRTLCLVVSVVMNLSLLSVFKYSSFAIESINGIFGTSIQNPNLPLPIGISFFTFQSMSYTIDLYRGNIKVQKNFINFGAFVTMFPQIVAGPIVRYDDVEKQLNKRTIDIDKISDGIGRFIIGLGKKVLIANYIGEMWTTVKSSDYASLSTVSAWLGITAFTLQIYFDFSGYSDMAIGLGKMIGFDFPENFDHPYMSKSISEFWRRWHITLGGWFKSYVYIPLGGNRKGKTRTVINLAIVWFLTGLWHGAGVNFILWGVYYGIIIILEKFVYGKYLEKLPSFIQRFYSVILVIFGWILFEINGFKSIGEFFLALFGNTGTFFDSTALNFIHNYLSMLIIGAIGSTIIPNKVFGLIKNKNEKLGNLLRFAGEAVIFTLVIAYLVDASYNPFLYFNF